MKMLTEYLERALEFEALAENEANEAFKAELLKQASAYRKLAGKRAEQYGLPSPSSPKDSLRGGHKMDPTDKKRSKEVNLLRIDGHL
jgi:hypothetical protein